MKKQLMWKEEEITRRFFRTDELSRPTNELSLILIIESKNNQSFDFLHEFTNQNQLILRQLLAEHGGILFRGFDVTTPEQFETISSIVAYQLAENYTGIAPRKHITEHVFTTTEFDSHAIIIPHSELAYSYQRPRFLSFYCDVEPLKYGETPIYNCQSMYDSLSPECLGYLEKGIQYVRYHNKKWKKGAIKTGAVWANAFSTEDKKVVEKELEKTGVQYEWHKNDMLKITTHPPAIITHPVTEKKSVNALLSHYVSYLKGFSFFKERYPLLLRYMFEFVAAIIFLKGKGSAPTQMRSYDGRPMPYRIVKELFDVYWKHSVLFAWKKNDVLVLDNIVTAHGRMNVVGPRRILCCLGDQYSVEAVDSEENTTNK